MAGLTADWCLVYATPDRVLAEILHGLIESSGISCTLVNRQDSSYIFLGEVELYVPGAEASEAMGLIRKTLDQTDEN